MLTVILVMMSKLTEAATVNQTVAVDFQTIRGPTTQRAMGYLGADFSDSSPGETVFTNYWLPVKPKLFSWIRPSRNRDGVYTFPGLNRARQLNAYYQVKIYHDPGDLSLGVDSAWGREVAGIAQAATATGYDKIQLDILNEPDWSGYWPFNGNYQDPRVTQAWRVAYDAAKAVNPNMAMVGINISSNNISWYKNTFLPAMKAENRLPDILSWHEINTPMTSIATRIADMRNYLAQNGMTQVRDISINEYNYINSYYQPGKSVQFISQLERGMVQSASRACWEEVAGGGYDCAPHLNGMLDANGNPRSVWWTYKAYADMDGVMVNTADPATFYSVASKNNSGVYRVLVGSVGSEPVLAVNLTGLESGSYEIKTEKIPNSVKSSLTAPTIVAQYAAAANNGMISVEFNSVQTDQAFVITATRTGTAPTATATPLPTSTPPTGKTGDANGDNVVDGVDYIVWLNYYGQSLTGVQYGDFDRSGRVDGVDYVLWLNNYSI